MNEEFKGFWKNFILFLRILLLVGKYISKNKKIELLESPLFVFRFWIMTSFKV